MAAAYLQNVTPRHRAIMRLLALGRSEGEIARSVGMSAARLKAIIESEVFKQSFNDFQDKIDSGLCDLREQLEELAEPAVNHLAHLMHNSKSENIQRQAAMNLLQCAGVGNKVVVDRSTAPALPALQVNVLLEALRESEPRPSITVEAIDVPALSPAEPQS